MNQTKLMGIPLALAALLSVSAQASTRYYSCTASCSTSCCCPCNCSVVQSKMAVINDFINCPALYRSELAKVLTIPFCSCCVDAYSEGLGQALVIATEHDMHELIFPLLQAGANVNAQGRGGWTALMWSADHGDEGIVTTLLAYNAALNIQDNEGRTALMWACISGHSDIVKILLEKGADITPSNCRGRTALSCAKDNLEIVRILLASTQWENVYGCYALAQVRKQLTTL